MMSRKTVSILSILLTTVVAIANTGCNDSEAFGSSTSVGAGPKGDSNPSDDNFVVRVIELTNEYRVANGVPPLAAQPQLNQAAQGHAEEMAATGVMTHTSVDGSSAGDRMLAAGYDWRTWGENVAYGYSTPEAVLQGWMNSSGHRANILSANFKELGVGWALSKNGTAYWAQNFGAR